MYALFINDAHRLGLAVILDVVYNHLGPVGNVLQEFSDWYFAEHDTDWGRGFNLDGPQSGPVRDVHARQRAPLDTSSTTSMASASMPFTPSSIARPSTSSTS